MAARGIRFLSLSDGDLSRAVSHALRHEPWLYQLTPISVELAAGTSVAVPYVDTTHTAHESCVAAVGGRSLALAGHAALETYAVLTRLPGEAQVDGATAHEILNVAGS